VEPTEAIYCNSKNDVVILAHSVHYFQQLQPVVIFAKVVFLFVNQCIVFAWPYVHFKAAHQKFCILYYGFFVIVLNLLYFLDQTDNYLR